MLKVQGVSKQMGKFAVRNATFQVNAGEYFMLLGPSGAGKTILLEIIAGLINPDSGYVELNNRNITKQPIQKRDIGLVFQNFELFPHFSVQQNIAFPLRNKGMKREEMNGLINELAEQFGIVHLLKQNVQKLSGGEQQRVALARTLATKPSILLLDEPMSALDAEKRTEIRSMLRNLNRKGQTIIHVTHDFEEAIALGHTIAVMGNGEIEQIGSTEEVFNRPSSNFVAKLVGVRNFFPATLSPSKEPNLMMARVKENLMIYLYAEKPGSGYILFPDSAVSITDGPQNTSALNNFKGNITDIYPHRYGYEVVVDIGIKVIVNITHESLLKMKLAIGKMVWISFKAGSVQFVPIN